jgi:hypothetical protein
MKISSRGEEEMKKVLLLMGIWLFLFSTVSFAAATPRLVNYQAMLADSAGTPLTGKTLTYSLKELQTPLSYFLMQVRIKLA